MVTILSPVVVTVPKSAERDLGIFLEDYAN